jgi:hypothetical protein
VIRSGRALAAQTAASAAALLLLAAAAHAETPVARDYVDGFCAPVAGGYVSGGALRKHLADWGFRPASSAEGDLRRPEGAAAPGQLMRAEDAAAPDAYVDPRGGACTLVWPGASLPEAARTALHTGALPVGEGGAASRWRPVRPVFAGRPPPPRWLMPMGGFSDRGLCAEAGEDLRRRDGAPVSLLRLAECRLGAGETAAEAP